MNNRTDEQVRALLIDVLSDIRSDEEIGGLINPIQVAKKKYAEILSNGKHDPRYVQGIGNVIVDALMESYGAHTNLAFIYLDANEARILRDGKKLPEKLAKGEIDLIYRLGNGA